VRATRWPTTCPSAPFQAERQGQWTKGKSCDNFGQLGPWLVTRDEVADPQDLSMYCRVNGETMQDGSTRTMVYGVAHLVSYLSQFFTLHPGDVISTGTPPAWGWGRSRRATSGPVRSWSWASRASATSAGRGRGRLSHGAARHPPPPDRPRRHRARLDGAGARARGAGLLARGGAGALRRTCHGVDLHGGRGARLAGRGALGGRDGPRGAAPGADRLVPARDGRGVRSLDRGGPVARRGGLPAHPARGRGRGRVAVRHLPGERPADRAGGVPVRRQRAGAHPVARPGPRAGLPGRALRAGPLRDAGHRGGRLGRVVLRAREVAACPNVHVKLSGISAYARPEQRTEAGLALGSSG
jgi:hypothetical protein